MCQVLYLEEFFVKSLISIFIYLTKKDKCNKCTKFKNIKETGNLNENDLQLEREHAIKK